MIELFTGKDDHVYFRFKAANNEKVLQSKFYPKGKEGNIYEHAKKDLKEWFENGGIIEEKVAKTEMPQTYFIVKLRHDEQKLIAWSETYTTKQARKHGIIVVKEILNKFKVIEK